MNSQSPMIFLLSQFCRRGSQLKSSISAVRHTFTPGSHSEVAAQLVGDVCGVVNSTIQEMYTVLEDKACEIEDSIANDAIYESV